MRLAVDANILVSELLRERGRALLRRPELELYMAEKPWEEARHELGKRVFALARAKGLDPQRARGLLEEALALAEERVEGVPEPAYAPLRQLALKRVPRDPDDWPTVALALALGAGVWTNDGDFLGCGVATWTTDTLLGWLEDEEGRDGGASAS